jgi:6-phosphogluconate dehydrogenase
MLPAGSVVDEQIDSLYDLLQQGDIIIDGGNTYYKDDLARAERLSQKGICYMDVGVSGGILGLKQGYCLMIGGNKDTFKYLEPIFQSLSYDNGYLYCGRTGAGHFAKMIHNGIEYAMMQAYGEGFELIDASPYANEINYADLAHVWNRGSIIRSWLLELTEKVFRDDPLLLNIRGYVEDSGEGRWTVKEAVDMTVSAPVISMALFERFRSRKEDALSHRLISALRKEFGGHMVKKK